MNRKIQDALQSAGAVFVRTGKHDIYRLPNGRTLVISRSPSDVRSERNELALIRRISKEGPCRSV